MEQYSSIRLHNPKNFLSSPPNIPQWLLYFRIIRSEPCLYRRHMARDRTLELPKPAGTPADRRLPVDGP